MSKVKKYLPYDNALTFLYYQIIKTITTIRKNLKYSDDTSIYESVKITLEDKGAEFSQNKGSIYSRPTKAGNSFLVSLK